MNGENEENGSLYRDFLIKRYAWTIPYQVAALDGHIPSSQEKRANFFQNYAQRAQFFS